MTDALKVLTENTAKAIVPGVGVIGLGSVFTKRWAEMSQPREKQKEETPKTGDEIAADVMKRAGLHQKAVNK